MKIVLFGPAWPFRGGVPHFTGALKLALERAGHTVEVVNFEKLSPALFTRREQFDDSPDALRIESERVFVPWDPRTWKDTARVIAFHQPDVILAQWWLPALGPGYRAVFRALPFALREKWVYLVHDTVSHERFPGDTLLARMALREAFRFVALSQAEARVLWTLLPELRETSVRVAPHPLFDSYAPFPGTAAEARAKLNCAAPHVLLFFGFVREYKGLDLLLRAMPQILAQDPNTKLLVCGPFHEARAGYERIIAECHLGASVVIHDRYFSGTDVSLCFAAADAVVLPYRSATQSGVVPLAYALGVPAISTLAGGLAEVVKDGITGVVIPSLEPTAIAAAVENFYTLGGRPAFTEGVRREAARYTWDAFLQAVIPSQS